MAQLSTLDSLLQKGGLRGKSVLVRVDLNVPMHHGRILDTTRIEGVIPTLKALAGAGARVVVLSHFGRPKGTFEMEYSLAPVADALAGVMGSEVKFGVNCIGPEAKEAVSRLLDGELVLLENLRFHAGEEKNDKEFSKQLSELGEVFVNDAFSCSHRAHASIVGLTEYLPSYAGYLLEKEVEHLEAVLQKPERPIAAIVGGAKVSTKLKLLESLVSKMDFLVIGGGMANTFLHAQGINVGASLCEKDLADTAKAILKAADKSGCKVLLPEDVVVADSLKSASSRVVDVSNVPDNAMILDVGTRTVVSLANNLATCKTVVWNGPLGVFEQTPYDVGSIALARMVAGLTQSGLKSIAGGGDIIAALTRGGLTDSFTYISTAGGAFLEWLEGHELPGVHALYH